MAIGPVQLFVLGFDQPDFHGESIAELERLKEDGTIRVIAALEAKAAVGQNLTRLLLGLGVVALVVGGVGIANVMVISVLERRSEIGLRRALGAKRSHIAGQFLTESILLSILRGIAGVALGTAVTYTYAARQGWLVDIPIPALGAGIAVAPIVGAVAGLYPAIRAARMDPAEAVHPTG